MHASYANLIQTRSFQQDVLQNDRLELVKDKEGLKMTL
jgi:hypothetical protein